MHWHWHWHWHWHCLTRLLACTTIAAIALQLVFLVAFAIGWRRMRQRPTTRHALDAPAIPGVSILRPCVGLDDALEDCLIALYQLDYPAYEILLGVPALDDPALPVLSRVRKRYPQIPTRIVITGAASATGNPKVAQLDVMARHARYGLYWISDSNTAPAPDTLLALAGAIHASPDTVLAANPIAGVGEQTLGATLDNLHLGAFVAWASVAIYALNGRLAVPGKSLLVRRPALERIGGFAALRPYLAEDHVLIEQLRHHGGRCRLTLPVVPQQTPTGTVASFVARYLRWTQMHWRCAWAVTLVEPLLLPVVPAALWAVSGPTPARLLWVVLLAVGQHQVARRLVSCVRGAPLAPRHAGLAALLHAWLFTWIWLQALVRRRVSWRGTTCVLSAGSRLTRVEALEPLPAPYAEPDYKAG